MQRELFRKINNIFHNDERINEFKNKLQNNQQLPRKYHNMFALNNDNDLVYLPKNLVIIPHADKEQFIKNTMENNLNIIGHGVTAYGTPKATVRQEIFFKIFSSAALVKTRLLTLFISTPIVKLMLVAFVSRYSNSVR
jgi:hypothetical protein